MHDSERSMTELSEIRTRFAGLNCCVLIPTYNNDHALEGVISGVLKYCSMVIIVNDGSTDRTESIIAKFPEVHNIRIKENAGKGWALREGFRYAIQKGYRYAVTIDSDGQHFPEDLPLFLDIIEQHPDSMIVGARNMNKEEVPGTSSFGHKFSIFWFRVETGKNIPDVQTGYRLYPLDKLKELGRLHTVKYEFEVEILVRLAWRGVKVLSVPVQVYYAPKESRVSHFRKFRDFTRVSIVNTVLVILGLAWYRPVAFFRSLKGKSVRDFFNEYFVNSGDTNAKLAKSVALGLFIGVTPIWGWQIVTTIGLAHLFKLNKFVAVTVSNISLPPMLPLVVFFSYLVGGWVLGGNVSDFEYRPGLGLQWIKENLLQYVVGSFSLGGILAIIFGPFTYFLLRLLRKESGG